MFDDEQQNEQNNQDLNNFTEGLDADVINNDSETSSYSNPSPVQNTEEETPVTDGNPASIKLGGSGPLTGAAAVYGNDVKNAAELAVKEINAKEGYEYFEFNYQDDEADPTKAPNAYGTLVDWGMQVSIYTTTSGAGLAVAADYNADRIFAITPSGSNPGLVVDAAGNNYDNLFQVCFTDPNQGVASANYIS